jgi:hypothetical protein
MLYHLRAHKNYGLALWLTRLIDCISSSTSTTFLSLLMQWTSRSTGILKLSPLSPNYGKNEDASAQIIWWLPWHSVLILSVRSLCSESSFIEASVRVFYP